MTEQELIDLLTTDDVCGGRISPVKAKQTAVQPYAVYDVIRSEESREISGDNGIRNRYMFTVWCNTYNEAVTTITDFKTSLANSAFSAGSAMITLDPDDESLYRIINLDFYIIE